MKVNIGFTDALRALLPDGTAGACDGPLGAW